MAPNYPTNLNSLNSLNKNIKTDDDTIIITEENIKDYGMVSVDQISWTISSGKIPSNSNVIMYLPSNIYTLMTSLSDLTVKIKVVSENLCRWVAANTIVDTYLPGTRIQIASGVILINSTFLDVNKNGLQTRPDRWNLTNSTILVLDNNYKAFDDTNYTNYFDQTSHILLDSFEKDSTVVLRPFSASDLVFNTYNKPIIINKPINLVSFSTTKFNADITFVAGSEGSNITCLTMNGNLYINTSNINVRNNTINSQVIVKDASDVVIEENTFSTTETPIVLESVLTSTVKNNNITTSADYIVSIDSDSAENTITENDLNANILHADKSVEDNGEDNTISQNTPIVYSPELKVDTTEFTIGKNTTITASIYLGDDVMTDINAGKVVFKVNGKTLKDFTGKVIYAKVVNGTATIENYEIPQTWNRDNLTITAVYQVQVNKKH